MSEADRLAIFTEYTNELKAKALEQFKQGKPLFGKEGAFAPMLKNFLEEALNAEMENHLNQEVRKTGNKRNGKKQKIIKNGNLKALQVYLIQINCFIIQVMQIKENTY